MKSPSPREVFLFGVILAYAIAVRVKTADFPFHRSPEGVGAFNGIIARNYFRYPWSQTLGMPVMSMGLPDKTQAVFYTHHPPLIPLLIAGSYAIFDDPHQADYVPAEWLTRLPTSLFTLGCIVVVYWMVRSRAGVRPALIAAALLACVPMTIYSGGQPDVINSQLAFFILLTLAAYLKFWNAPTAKSFGLLCLAFFPAGYTDWPAFYIVVVLTIHFAITRPFKQWLWIVGFGAFAVLVFFIAYGQIAMVNGGNWAWIIEPLRKRTVQSMTDERKAFTMGQWFVEGFLEHNFNQHTRYVLLLGFCWLALLSWRKDLRGPMHQLTWLLLAWAGLHIVIGRQGVYEHDWWWWPLTPGLVIASALFIEWMLRELQNAKIRGGEIAAIVLLVAFGWYTTYATLRELFHPLNLTIGQGQYAYTIVEMGEAIRAAAPPNSAVLLAESDATIGIWYYGDRPIIKNVWDAATVESRMNNPQTADILWDLKQSWTEKPKGLVIPKAYLKFNLEAFVEYLKGKYPKYIDSDKFLVFDLTPQPMTP